jgi:hypothetical protein
MSCCGDRSRSTTTAVPLARAVAAGAVARTVASPHMTVHYEYIGHDRLVAVGPVTGRPYRFEAAGQVLPVDLRDASALSAVPNLRRLQRT